MRAGARVGLVAWGNCLQHDFLQKIGVTPTEFRRSFTGSWHFGYVRALREAGVETTSFIFSCCSRRAESFMHEPTQSRFVMLPAAILYRLAFARSSRANNVVAEYLGTPLLKLARWIRAERCASILIQGRAYPRFEMTVVLARLLGLPVFSTDQGGGDDGRRGRILDAVRRKLFEAASGLIVPGEAEVARLQLRYGVDPSRVARILNPVDTAFWHPTDRDAARQHFGLPHEAVVICWHGRVALARKGLDILVEAWREVRRSVQRPVLLHLLGTGTDHLRLEQLLDGVEGITWIRRFATDRHEARDFLSAGDAYIFTSRAEGFALAPVEASACGLPVIASSMTPGITELFSKGEDSGALLIHSLDPRAFAREIARIVVDDELRHRLARAAVTAAADLSLPKVGAQLAAFLCGTSTANGGPQSLPTGRRAALSFGTSSRRKREQWPINE